MIVSEILNDLFTNRSVTLTKALLLRFEHYLATHEITMTGMEYLFHLQSLGYITLELYPDQTTYKVKRIL